MIYWGTAVDLIGEHSDVAAEKCKICSEHSKPVYKVEQNYFKLYGLPIFPTKKMYYKTCSACSTKLKAKSTDSNMRSVKAALPGNLKLKYVWGWIILVPIILGIVYLLSSIRDAQ
jgi:zinc-ribbon family